MANRMQTMLLLLPATVVSRKKLQEESSQKDRLCPWFYCSYFEEQIVEKCILACGTCFEIITPRNWDQLTLLVLVSTTFCAVCMDGSHGLKIFETMQNVIFVSFGRKSKLSKTWNIRMCTSPKEHSSLASYLFWHPMSYLASFPCS